ncbi:MAG: hypothetical protein WCI34_07355 [Actinomycetes bacterium]
MRRAIKELRRDSGQALTETLALVPIVVALSIAIARLAVWMIGRRAAEEAASAASVAVLEGADGRSAAVQALPSWARGKAAVTVSRTQARVVLSEPLGMEWMELPDMTATVKWAPVGP